MSSPKTPQPTAAQLQQEDAQATASAMLDQQENERRKRLLNAAAGLRAFSGSALGRALPGNTAAGAPSAAQAASPASPGSMFIGGAGAFGGAGGGGRIAIKPA